MAATTSERVIAIASHLAGASVLVDIAIEDAASELKLLGISASHTDYERIQRYLAAHYATIDKRRPTLGRVGPVQTSFANPMGSSAFDIRDLATTEYGQEALRLIKRIKGPSLVVIP